MSEITPRHLRVSRPWSACSRCRSAKVKCDGKLPACSACEKAGKAKECNGGSDQFAKGKERSYVASLESRIEKLEKKLALMSSTRRTSASAMMMDATGPTGQPIEGFNRIPTMSAKRRAEGAHMEELISDLGFITVNATSKGAYDFTENMTFARFLLRASSVKKTDEPPPSPCHLPLRNQAMNLAQYYFDNILVQYPFFLDMKFLSSLDSVYQEDSFPSNLDIFMVYMVLAISTLSLSNDRDSMNRRLAHGYVTAALEHVDQVLVPNSTIGIQCTLLLLQYALLEPGRYNAWYLIGVASRISIDLGLHQEPPKVLKIRPADLELRRRIFYSVYAYDRFVSMTYERPFSFSDEAIMVSLPKMDDSFAHQVGWHVQPTTMNAAVENFKFSMLNSTWYQNLFFSGHKPQENPEQYCEELRNQLYNWQNEIPSTLAPSHRNLLDIEYFYMYVYIYVANPRIPAPSERAHRAIIEYASKYERLFTRMLAQPQRRFNYTYCDAVRARNVGMKLVDSLLVLEDFLIVEGAMPLWISSVRNFSYLLEAMSRRWIEARDLRDEFVRHSEPLMAKYGSEVAPGFSPADSPEDALRHLDNQVTYNWPDLGVHLQSVPEDGVSFTSSFSSAGPINI